MHMVTIVFLTHGGRDVYRREGKGCDRARDAI